MAASRKTHARLSVEALEARTLLAANVTAFLLGDGLLKITGSNDSERVRITQEAGQICVYDDVSANTRADGGLVGKFVTGRVRTLQIDCLGGDDQVQVENSVIGLRVTANGGAGNDTLVGGWNTINWLYGGAGNDTLIGGRLDDVLRGEAGMDVLKGSDGNDTLFGGTEDDALAGGPGNDVLYGEAGNDTLEGNDGDDKLYGGAGNDYHYGGAGKDFLADNEGRNTFDRGPGGDLEDFVATKAAPSGAFPMGIQQKLSATCWFLASLGAYAAKNDPVASERFRYVGGNTFEVQLFAQSKGRWEWKSVEFDGTRTATDPATANRGEFWAVIYQRAMLKDVGIDWKNDAAVQNAFDYSGRGLVALTGKQVQYFKQSDFNLKTLQGLVRAGRLVVADTGTTTTDLVGVAQHAYTVVDVFDNGTVQLRNPWGRDGGSRIDGDNDGYINVDWKTFASVFTQYWATTDKAASSNQNTNLGVVVGQATKTRAADPTPTAQATPVRDAFWIALGGSSSALRRATRYGDNLTLAATSLLA